MRAFATAGAARSIMSISSITVAGGTEGPRVRCRALPVRSDIPNDRVMRWDEIRWLRWVFPPAVV